MVGSYQATQIKRPKRPSSDYSVNDGLLHFKGRLCVLAKLKNEVMKKAHETPLAAHPGYHKMFATLKKTFF